jgi:hypothetical protein
VFFLPPWDDSNAALPQAASVICDRGNAMIRGLALLACAALSACATTDAPNIEVSDQQRCVQEARIGSSIPATKCYDRVVAKQQKHDADQIVDRIRRAPVRSSNGGAGGGN